MRDMFGLMKQAQAMQEKIQEMQAELERLEVEGQSGGGMVRVTLSAKGQMRNLAIDDQLLKADEKEILEDLIVTAHEDARKKAERADGGKNERRDGGSFAAAGHEAPVLMRGEGSVRWPNAFRPGDRAADPIAGALAGLGPRSARRAALHLIRKREELFAPLADALRVAIEKIVTCRVCGNVDTCDPCSMCRDERRDRDTLVVVETVADLWALERAAALRALPCAWRNLVAARRRRPEGLEPRQPRRARRADRVHEVVLAVNATVDGQTTAHYVAGLLAHLNVKMTRLAHGVPVGGELDYLDEGTLAAAMRAGRFFEVPSPAVIKISSRPALYMGARRPRYKPGALSGAYLCGATTLNPAINLRPNSPKERSWLTHLCMSNSPLRTPARQRLLRSLVRLETGRHGDGARLHLHDDRRRRGHRRRHDENSRARRPNRLAAVRPGRRCGGGDRQGEIAWRDGLKDITEVMRAGSFSIIIDPTGAAIGLWQEMAK